MTDQGKDNFEVQLGEPLNSTGVIYRSRNESKATVSPKAQPSMSDSSWKLESWNPELTAQLAASVTGRRAPLPGSLAGLSLF